MPAPNLVAQSPLDLIGNTPVVRLNRLGPPQGAEIWAKLEMTNPGGSLKDRIALSMIEEAEKSGELHPGSHIVEPTSGNTGIGLAFVAAVKGYRLTLTMPDTMTEERRSLLTGYGVGLELTPDNKGMQAAVDRAEAIAATDSEAFLPRQFSNPANPLAHATHTASEILTQMPRLDAFVAGVGTGGTITGISPALKAERPDCRIIAVEPAASAVIAGEEPGMHGIQGIGAGFIPENLDRQAFDAVESVTDEEATLAARQIAEQEGLLVGISSGANLVVAQRVAAELPPEAVVLTLFCDSGERYLTTDLFTQPESPDRQGGL
jgi:cysteine synthase A